MKQEEKQCSCCGEPIDKPNSRYCKKCHAAYMRDWRKKDKKKRVIIVNHAEPEKENSLLHGAKMFMKKLPFVRSVFGS